MIKRCKKLKNGEMEYEIDFENRRLRLHKDIPECGDSGARFSKEWISFDTINTVIQTDDLGNNSKKIDACFSEQHSANNAPMLSAVLLDLRIIDLKYNVLSLFIKE